MSVTFWCPDAPRESESPAANFANMNARAVLSLLDEDFDDLYGNWDVATLASVRQRLLVLINSIGKYGAMAIAIFDRRETITGGNGTATMITCGNTSDDTLRRLQYIEEVVIYAQENSYSVSWS